VSVAGGINHPFDDAINLKGTLNNKLPLPALKCLM